MQPTVPIVASARPVIVPPWMPIAFGELGEVEDVRRGKSNARIEAYHEITFAGRAVDDVPWCASFVGWCLESGGVRSTRSKSAASYAPWGVSCGYVFGALAVFAKSDPDAGGSGHTAFLLGVNGATAWILGGNQSNAVTIASRSTRGMRTRWPSTVTLPDAVIR